MFSGFISENEFLVESGVFPEIFLKDIDNQPVISGELFTDAHSSSSYFLRAGQNNTSGFLAQDLFLSTYENKVSSEIDDPSFGVISTGNVTRTLTVTNLYNSGIYLNDSSLISGLYLDIEYPYFIPALHETGIPIIGSNQSGVPIFSGETGVINFGPLSNNVYDLSGQRQLDRVDTTLLDGNFGTISGSNVYRDIYITNYFDYTVSLESSDLPVGLYLDITYPLQIPALSSTGIQIAASPLSGVPSFSGATGTINYDVESDLISGFIGQRPLGYVTTTISEPSYGFITSATSKPLTISNYYDSGIYLDSVDIPLGFVISETLPLYIEPLAVSGINLTAIAESGLANFTDQSGVFYYSTADVNVVSGLNGLRLQSDIFKWRPFGNFIERLDFKTDVLTKRDGSEQRYSTRSVPRQSFLSSHMVEQGKELALFENFISKWRDQKILFPIWSEPMVAETGIGEGSNDINVNTTNFTDVRSGGYLGIVSGNVVTEFTIISTFDENGFFIANPLSKAYPPKTEVLPLKLAYINKCDGQRYQTKLERKNVSVDIAEFLPRHSDASGYYDNYSGKLLINDLNFIKGKTMDNQFIDDIVRIDGGDGDYRLEALWDTNKKEKTKGFITLSREEIWKTKGLFYYLDGKRKSFYMPSYNEDLIPTSNLSSSSNLLEIEYIGYSSYLLGINDQYDTLQLVKKNGEKIIKKIISSEFVDGVTENIYVDSNWGEDINVNEIFSLQILEKTRLNSDNITITHKNAIGYSEIFVKTINTK